MLRRILPLSLVLAALTGLPACKQSSFKLPKLKWKNKAAGADPVTGVTPVVEEPLLVPAPTPSVARTPEETAFLEKCAVLGSAGGTVAGRDGYNFAPVELQRLAQLVNPNASSIQAATSAIAHYHALLKSKGTELVFVPVPPKAVIFPDKLDKDLKIKVRRKKPARLDSTLQAVYANLRARGIRVIDPTDTLLAAREDKKAGPIFPLTAAVWSPRGAERTAALIASELKGAKWANQPGTGGPLITENGLLNYSGPLTAGTAVAEALSIRNIGRAADGKMRSVTFSQGGHPLALIGDSSLLAWREANNPAGSTGAFGSLADQLAFEFQTTPDLFPGKGDGRNASRQRLLREATNGRNPLGSTKVVLWVVQATDFAVTDWKKVPLRLTFTSSQPPVMLTPPVGLIPDTNASGTATPPPSLPPATPDTVPDSGAAPAPGEPDLPR